MRHILLVCYGCAAAAAPLLTVPMALGQTPDSVRMAAEQLEERTKPEAAGEQKSTLSDSAVRVMTSFAWSLVPEQFEDDGKTIKLDKSDPNKFFIPSDDARRIIRAATRTAYATACNLPDLAQANYEALMVGEAQKNVWSQEQMVFIDTLHRFTALYLTGNVQINEEDDEVGKQSGADAKAGGEAGPAVKPPSCDEAQKQKVKTAIETYVKSARAATPPPAKAESTPAPQTAPAAKPAPPAQPASEVQKKAPLASD